MPSPFPGMDPYLEDRAIWSDFHGTFLMAIRAELNRILPEHYVARWDRYVWIDEPDAEESLLLGKPDTFVTDALDRERDVGGIATLASPATAILPAVDPKGKPFLKIVDLRGRRVVTAVEMLSPANKSAGKDGDAYLAKRQEYFRTGTNLVEMDFRRTGRRPPLEGNVSKADYYIVISRAVDYPKACVWPLAVRDPLPPLPVPLDPAIAAVEVDLGSCFRRAYDEARFDEDIDYSQPPPLALLEADALWAREVIAAHNQKESRS